MFVALTALECVLAHLASPVAAQPQQPPRQLTVLSLNSLRRGSPASAVNDAVFQKVLGAGQSSRLDYYAEDGDLARFSGPEYDQTVRDYLRGKYGGRRFDVVIASGDSALEFAARYRDELFPGTPIVFSTRPGSPVPTNATGVFVDVNLHDTVGMIAAL